MSAHDGFDRAHSCASVTATCELGGGTRPPRLQKDVRDGAQSCASSTMVCGTGGIGDLMQGVEIAVEQLGVRELGLGEAPGHVLAVWWIVWVRPSAANPDLQAEYLARWIISDCRQACAKIEQRSHNSMSSSIP